MQKGIIYDCKVKRKQNIGKSLQLIVRWKFLLAQNKAKYYLVKRGKLRYCRNTKKAQMQKQLLSKRTNKVCFV